MIETIIEKSSEKRISSKLLERFIFFVGMCNKFCNVRKYKKHGEFSFTAKEIMELNGYQLPESLYNAFSYFPERLLSRAILNFFRKPTLNVFPSSKLSSKVFVTLRKKV